MGGRKSYSASRDAGIVLSRAPGHKVGELTHGKPEDTHVQEAVSLFDMGPRAVEKPSWALESAC